VTESTNRFDGNADNVIQVGDVHGDVHNYAPPPPRRPKLLWAAIGGVLLLVVAGGLVVLLNQTGDSKQPLAVQSKVNLPKDCSGGWVVPDTGDTPIKGDFTARPPNAELSDGGQVTLTLQGLRSSAVVLDSMRVDVVSRKPAAKGVLLPAYCGSNIVPRSFRVDLGQPMPTAKPQDGHDGGDVVKAGDFPFKISDTDPEQFIVTALSPTEDVEWRLVLAWSSGSQHGELVVDDNGKPFRSTATTNTRFFCPDPNNSTWHLPNEDAPCGMMVTPSYARYLTPLHHTGSADTLSIGYSGLADMTYNSHQISLAAVSVSAAQLVLKVSWSKDHAIPVGSTFTFRPDGDKLTLTDPNGISTTWN